MRDVWGIRVQVVVLMLVLAPMAAWARPMPVGLWEFNDSTNLTAASAGNDLALVGSQTAVNGWTDGDGAVEIGPGSYYQCMHGLPESNGGEQVNAYTLVFDFKVDDLASWHSFFQTAVDNSTSGESFINPDGQIGVTAAGYSHTAIQPKVWYRLAIAVSLDENQGIIDYFLDGQRIQRGEVDFWDVVFGTSDLLVDGRFSLSAVDTDAPWVLLFADDDGADGTITVSTVALYGRALSETEIADLGDCRRYFLIPDVPGATTVTFDGFQNLGAGHYETIYISDMANVVDLLRFDDVEIDSPGVLTSMGEGYFNYFNQGVTIKNLTQSGDGYRATCSLQIPKLLGGLKEEVDFDIGPAGAQMVGGRFEIPNLNIEETLELKNAYVEIRPEEGIWGGGGVMKLPTWGQGLGGSIEMKAGIGPEIFGVRGPDVTELGLKATGLDIPIGEIFSIYSVGLELDNDLGLSNPVNWYNTGFCGSTKVVAGPKIEVLGRAYFAYAFDATGCFSPHDGSIDVEGTGLLFNTIETNSLSAKYDPPYNLSLDCRFSALDIFIGEMAASISNSGFVGSLSGHFGIPPSVPVVGGWTFADVGACLANTVFSGSVDINITPAIPSICTPQWCPPQLCISLWYCDNTCWWWWIPYPCNCYWHTSCWQPPCIPPICTPAIPAISVHFGFSFDGATGAFAFNKAAEGYHDWEIPVKAPMPVGDGAFTFLTNWDVCGSACTTPIRKGQQPIPLTKDGPRKADFTITDETPGALFRCNFENEGMTSVDMTVTAPSGTSFGSDEGLLPNGYAADTGFSRFSSDAREQVILLVNPAPGTYTVTVNDSEALGEFTVDMLLQDQQPWGEITSITAGEEEGVYDIAWVDEDLEGENHVSIFLDHDREDADGFLMVTLDEEGNTGSYSLDTRQANVHAGDYFIMLEVNDGVNPPYQFYSHDTIEVTPEGAPEPPTNLQFLPDDGAFHISWDASPTEDLRGYLVLFTDQSEDISHFDRRYFVAADATQLAATVDGLENDVTLLATVVALDENGLRSRPSDIVRITPRVPDEGTPPKITSTPDSDATAGYQFTYLATFSDASFADSYTWSLDSAPDGMEVDASCGLVTWTPAEDQEGINEAVLRITEDGENGLTDAQTFEVTVYPAELVNGVEAHTYQVASSPALHATDEGEGGKLSAVAGETYMYQMSVWGPTDDVDYELKAGPDGMTIDETGLITWEVPHDASGAWVRVIITAEGEHMLEQDFYLHVHKESHIPVSSGEGEGEGEGATGMLEVSPAGQQAFGFVEAGDSKDVVFTLRNTGDAALTGEASVQGDGYEVVDGGSYTVGAGGSVGVTVRFAPAEAQGYRATAQFTSNHGDTVAVVLTGTGTEADSEGETPVSCVGSMASSGGAPRGLGGDGALLMLALAVLLLMGRRSLKAEVWRLKFEG